MCSLQPSWESARYTHVYFEREREMHRDRQTDRKREKRDDLSQSFCTVLFLLNLHLCITGSSTWSSSSSPQHGHEWDEWDEWNEWDEWDEWHERDEWDERNGSLEHW